MRVWGCNERLNVRGMVGKSFWFGNLITIETVSDMELGMYINVVFILVGLAYDHCLNC